MAASDSPAAFDAHATDFSLENAWFLARASQAAYDVAHLAIAVPGAWPQFAGSIAPFSNGKGDDDKGVSGFVSVDDQSGIILLCFRGTANLPGWMTDFDAFQQACPKDPLYVHYGFLRALDEVWDHVQAALPTDPGGRGVWVTGHSLGGALATLAAARLCDAKYPLNVVYTFGSPRVGNPDFCTAYQPTHYRFVNNDDIVPRVPADKLLALNRELLAFLKHPLDAGKHFTYGHTGKLKYFDHDGKLGDGLKGMAEAKDALAGTLGEMWKAKPAAFEDHRISNYIAAIEKNL